MRAWIISDLHLRPSAASLEGLAVPDADVCICAGNVSSAGMAAGVRLLGLLVCPKMPVIFVPGNHDYKGRSIPEVMKDARSAAALHRGLYILDEETLQLGGVLFVGATLWSDLNLFGDQRLAIEFARRSRDYTDIKTSRQPRKRFSPRQSISLHHRARLFIERSLALPRNLPAVVVTHHAPSLQSVPQYCFNDPLAPTYASSLERLILETRPDLWVHGGVCESRNYSVGGTKIVANPRGFGVAVDRGVRGRPGCFIPELVIDISRDFVLSQSAVSEAKTVEAAEGRKATIQLSERHSVPV